MYKMLFALAAVALLAAAPAAKADVLIIEKLEAARTEMPTRGMTMQRVESRFGKPLSISGPVGDPPITRWNYGDFVVMFEYSHVIHSVERPAQPPKPAS